MRVISKFERIRLEGIVLASHLELLLCGSEHVNLLILFGCVEFGALGVLLEDHFFLIGLHIRQFHIFEKLVLEQSQLCNKYSVAVGLFLEEYRNMDSIKSMASIEAVGIISAKLIPFSSGK